MTVHFDCRAIAKEYREWVSGRLSIQDAPPGLAAVMSSSRADDGSRQYRDLILKDAAKMGIGTRSVEVSDEHELRETIGDLNMDPTIHGIVVLYPLGFSRPDDEVMDLVSPRKDIEGLHSINLGYLIKYRRWLNEEKGIKCVVPATAKAVVKTLQSHPEVRIDGAYVVIINNSMRVGKPLGLMLENLGATVVKCYDKTRPEVLADCVRGADIVVTAVPDPSFSLDPGLIKDGAAVLDVSYQGNVDSKALEGRATAITTPDNRVGRVTRAMMLVNLAYCWGLPAQPRGAR